MAPIEPSALVAPALAGVTLKATGEGMGVSGSIATTIYIKGNKMRTDTVIGDTTRTTIFDVDAERFYSFDSKATEADAWDMLAFRKNQLSMVDTENVKVSIKANGQTKQIAGKSADGYDMELSLPTTMDGKKVTALLTGPLWVVKGAPGTAEVINFYKGAVDKGWIFSDPRGAEGNPALAKLMAEMYRQVAAIGGITYEQELRITVSSEGPMASMLTEMGGMTVRQTVQSVETGALAADLFAPPAGYKIKEQK